MFGKRFRNFIIGKSNYVASWVEYKHAILRGHLIVLCLLVGVVYLAIDMATDIRGNEPYYVAVIITGLLTLYLNRIGKYKLANVLFVATINVIVFLFASNDQYRSGVYMFFVIVGMTAITLFGIKERRWSLFFVLLSVGLFFLSYWGGITIRQVNTYSEAYIQTNFAINFCIALASGISLIYFLMGINQSIEKEILDKNELLAKTNQELDRFVYSASHDLRAPLRSLLGLIEVTQKSTSAEEIQECLVMMKDRVHNMDAFIREIIDFSRNARKELNCESILIADLLNEVIDDLKFADGYESIYVRLTIPAGYTVVTDKARLNVVLHNLVGNAFKYFDPQKEHPEVAIAVAAEGQDTTITISDNGVGIAPEHQSRIFEMFYRASEQSTGSGLGLYIVKETLARLHGTIQFKSTLGQGSVFMVTLPENR
ncbi:MAG: HAMP domain-containing histidine kinase [Cytophagales bacterium]|nr:HAMP domain-containing histidine kinase [Cytophagales bacterium]